MQYKTCLIGVLGLQEHEVRLLGSILSHSNARAQMRYEWAGEVSQAHLVVVNGDNEAALQEWQGLTRDNPSTILLLISAKAKDISAEYCLTRPFAPAKILAVLDQIFKDKLVNLLEQKIFAGEGQSAQREAILAAQGDVFARVHRALVVDDSPTVRKQLELELVAINVQVDCAESGEQCMERLENGRYDIILLDVVMPGADGYEVCKNIRKNPETKQTPVILLTSRSSSFDRVRGALAGCSAYLTKPVDYEKFHTVLREHLKGER